MSDDGDRLASARELWDRHGTSVGVITMSHEDAIAYAALSSPPYASIDTVIGEYRRSVTAAGRGELTAWGRPVRIRPLMADRRPKHPRPVGARTTPEESPK